MVETMECFKNLTIKKDCPLSKEQLLKKNQIQIVTDTNDNQHIVLTPGQSFNDLTPIEKLYTNGVTSVPVQVSGQWMLPTASNATYPGGGRGQEGTTPPAPNTIL